MIKSIRLHDRLLDYTLRVSTRSRSLRLAVHGDGSLVVTVPPRCDERSVERYIVEKSEWVVKKMDFFKRLPGQVIKIDGQRGFAEYKENALALAENRLKHWNASYRFDINSVNIRNQKTRWGSCSRKGNLNFNVRIALLSPKLADYIVVHELCHLGEHNHSRSFWDLVGKAVPDHRELRRELRQIRIG